MAGRENIILQIHKAHSLFPVRNFTCIALLLSGFPCAAQVTWMNVDSAYAPLPSTLQVFKTTDTLEGQPFIAFYVKARLKDKSLDYTVDTTLGRRLTPLQFYEKNDQPLVVVNGSFFNFDRNQNLNVVIRDGRMLAYNIHTIPLKGKDSLQYRHPLASAIGIDKKRRADVAWLFTDSSVKKPFVFQEPVKPFTDSSLTITARAFSAKKKWKMRTAIGGGPVLVQNGQVHITNEEELKFTGKALRDKHPRTCFGYTRDGYLIIMVIQGRFPGIAEGATLEQEAKLLIDLGCVEALNADGGGSSCMLVNGKETISPSDKTGERPVPAVLLIHKK